jgi:hypothetical protein
MARTWFTAAIAALGAFAWIASAQEPAAPTPVDPGAPAVIQPCEHPSASGGSVIGGASLYYLHPYINNNTAIVTNTGVPTPSAVVTGMAMPATVVNEFQWPYRTGSAFWLGYACDSGLGVRARYFQFEQASDALESIVKASPTGSITITAPPGLDTGLGLPPANFVSPGNLLLSPRGVNLLSATSDLQIQTTDVEATYAWQTGNLQLLLFGGGRYLQMVQNYQTGVRNTEVGFNLLASGHHCYAAGPTAGLQSRCQVGDTGLALYGLGRGSLVVGDGRQDTLFAQGIRDPLAANQNSFSTSQARFNQVIPILELELGLEYGVDMRGSRLFVRVAGVNQTYFGAGSASSRDGNLSLFGGQVSLGVDY